MGAVHEASNADVMFSDLRRRRNVVAKIEHKLREDQQSLPQFVVGGN
jgi:hypothetical protein